MPKLRFFLIAAFFCLLSVVAKAHPHVWVYTDVEILVSNKKITGLKVAWNFDEIYSASFLKDADINKNMKLEEDEIKHTLQSVFHDNLDALYGFMHIQMNQKKSEFTVENPKVWMGDDETLTYTFEIKFEEAIQANGLHDIAFYDPEFYIAFEQSYDMKFSEKLPCTYKLEEKLGLTIYEGLFSPEIYQLTCKET